jgi:hypothetical protein
MDYDRRRLGVLKLVLEDIAGELTAVCDKEFVVEEDESMLRPCLPAENAGPYYIIYDGARESKERKPVLAVYQNMLLPTETENLFSPLLFFMPPDPFIVEYLSEYAREFNMHLSDFSNV